MNTKDWRDYTTYAFAAAILAAATLYAWRHPSDANFATWAVVVGSITGVLRWLDLKDDKEKDAS